MQKRRVVLLCPGQGAQAVGMGKGWMQSQTASAHTFAAADEIVDLGDAGQDDVLLAAPLLQIVVDTDRMRQIALVRVLDVDSADFVIEIGHLFKCGHAFPSRPSVWCRSLEANDADFKPTGQARQRPANRNGIEISR